MRLGRSFGILAILLLMAPSISHARQNEPPRKCIVNGRIDCSRKECARYCNNGNVSWPVAPPTVRPVPPTVRPVPPTVRPVPPTVRPVPPTVRTVRPVPPTVRPVPPTVRPLPSETIIVTHPIAPTPSPVVVVDNRRPLKEINREIKRLEHENDRLKDRLEEERYKAESEYEVCRRYIPAYLTNYCVYDDSRIRDIQAEIKENKRMIRQLEGEKSLW